MSTEISAAINELETMFRRIHGADIRLLLARPPSFGHADTCIIVKGANCYGAAKDLGLATKGTIERETGCTIFGTTYAYYTVTHQIVG